MVLKFIGALAFLIFAITPAYAETAQHALYHYTPQSRISYDVRESRLPVAKAAYLNDLFLLVERAYGSKLLLVKDFENNKQETGMEYYTETTGRILSEIKRLKTPEEFREAQALIESAIQDQGVFFQEWRATPTDQNERFVNEFASHPAVTNAHEKLLQAYYGLLKGMPKETERNKKAFYDSLCALDFI